MSRTGSTSQAGLDLWGVRANPTKTQETALTALEPLVFPRISTEIALVLAPAVDGMLSQPSPWELNVWPLSMEVATLAHIRHWY